MRFQYADGRMPVAMTKGDDTYYLACDQVGSPVAVFDASGDIVKELDRDSFGNLLSDSDPTFTLPFGFAGGLYDPDTGLVRFGYRDYDPDTGRWTAKDPILFAGRDTNLYGYVLNDPVSLIDPWGLYGIAVDFGGAYATGWGGHVNPNATVLQGGSAGTGFYIGTKGMPGYVEIGAYTYQSLMTNSGQTPGAALGAGVNFTVYLTDAEDFFPGRMKNTTYVIGPFSFVFSQDPCTDELTGVTFSILGKGLGWVMDETSYSYGYQGALQ